MAQIPTMQQIIIVATMFFPRSAFRYGIAACKALSRGCSGGIFFCAAAPELWRRGNSK